MTKQNLPYNFNMCYRIQLKLTEINGMGMADEIIITNTFGLLKVNVFLVMQLNSYKLEFVHNRG